MNQSRPIRSATHCECKQTGQKLRKTLKKTAFELSRLVILLSPFLCMWTSHAATWFVFNKLINTNTVSRIYFFDISSVVRQKEKVTVRLRFVNDQKNGSANGIYSEESKVVFSCTRRTVQTLEASTYDKDGVIIQVSSPPSTEVGILPGSDDEVMLTTICDLDFAMNRSGSLYSPIRGRDIDAYAKKLFSDIETDAAPHANPSIWYVFYKFYNNGSVYFFDKNSVTTQGNTVTFWMKHIVRASVPGTDGSYSSGQYYTFWCNDRRYATGMMSTYDKNGTFLRSYPPRSTTTMEVVPSQYIDNLYRAACSAYFPDDTSGTLYFPVEENDIFKFAYDFFRDLDSATKSTSPK
jgi:hypothetical protein